MTRRRGDRLRVGTMALLAALLGWGVVAADGRPVEQGRVPSHPVVHVERPAQEADTVGVSALWEPGLLRPSREVAHLHVWRATDDAGSWERVDSVAAADTTSGGLQEARFAAPLDTVAQAASFCVTAVDTARGRESPERCTEWQVPPMNLDPTAPGEPIVEPDSVADLAAADSMTLWLDGWGAGAVEHNTTEAWTDADGDGVRQARYVHLVWMTPEDGTESVPFVCGRVDGGPLSAVEVEVQADETLGWRPQQARTMAWPQDNCGGQFRFTASDTSVVSFRLGTEAHELPDAGESTLAAEMRLAVEYELPVADSWSSGWQAVMSEDERRGVMRPGHVLQTGSG